MPDTVDVVVIDDRDPPLVVEAIRPEVVETTQTTHEVVEVETPTVVVVESSTHEVVEVSEGHVVVVEAERVVVITEGIQGPPGVDGTDGLGIAREFSTNMQAGVLSYVLPELPRPGFAVVVMVNGVRVSAVLAGVNLTITEYTAGTIEDTDELSIYYFV